MLPSPTISQVEEEEKDEEGQVEKEGTTISDVLEVNTRIVNRTGPGVQRGVR